MRLYTDCIPCQMALDCLTGIQAHYSGPNRNNATKALYY